MCVDMFPTSQELSTTSSSCPRSSFLGSRGIHAEQNAPVTLAELGDPIVVAPQKPAKLSVYCGEPENAPCDETKDGKRGGWGMLWLAALKHVVVRWDPETPLDPKFLLSYEGGIVVIPGDVEL